MECITGSILVSGIEVKMNCRFEAVGINNKLLSNERIKSL